MRLRILEPVAEGVAKHLATISRKLRLNVLASTSLIEPKALIIIGDGTPGDYCMALVAWACDGEKMAFITKPKETGIRSVVRHMKETLIGEAPHLQQIIIVIDRDKRGLPDITEEARKALEEYGFEVLGRQELAGGWLKIFSCRWRPRAEIEITVLVNGLAKDEEYSKDTMDVHVLEAAKHVLKERISDLLRRARDEEDERGRVDPKTAWRLLAKNKRLQWKVFSFLKEQHSSLLRKLFKQHHRALERIA